MAEQKYSEGKIVIVSGPSGVGKSTICKEVVRRLKKVRLSVSVTTREKGENEVDGGNYWFVSKEQFQEWIDKEQLLEYAEVFGHLYGTPRDKVEEALAAGETIILEIDVQGAGQVRAKYPEAKMIFVLPPRHKDLVERLQKRGRDEIEAAKDRLNGADIEIAAGWRFYEHMVINEDLEQAINEVIKIIQQANGEKNDRRTQE